MSWAQVANAAHVDEGEFIADGDPNATASMDGNLETSIKSTIQ